MNTQNVKGAFASLFGKEYYKIENVHEIEPFFINLSTSSDLWMFLSSTGALTAGRGDAGGALFPYETDDRIHLNSAVGPKTLVRVNGGGAGPWEVFASGYESPYPVTRSLYKSLDGGSVAFEELNPALGLSFLYKWEAGEKYGLIRSCYLKNDGKAAVSGLLIDGLVNILPFGISLPLAASSSCLSDAYKASEFDGQIALYSLTTKINDSPEPEEILRANAAWSTGEAKAIYLASGALRAFSRGDTPPAETRVNGRKGAFLALREFSLEPGESMGWKIAIDAGRSQMDIAALKAGLALKGSAVLEAALDADAAAASAELVRMAGLADGLQCTGDKLSFAHHYMNVLYNNMRGGVFTGSYGFDPDEFERFAYTCDHELPARERAFFDELRSKPDIVTLKNKAFASGKAGLIRAALEFLPLCFSRRHGDPSRPWNQFSIRVKDEGGRYIYHYEGNWRDIFQNWEALCMSFPEYLENVVAKFLNASTADGYNPYRLSDKGIDWEAPESGNEWGGFGYWGDHQIVYLCRLLEALRAYCPEALERLMKSEIFAYANIPYEIVDYASICSDPKQTISFNYGKEEAIRKAIAAEGSDARLLHAKGTGELYLASFWEKILVPILAKLSNLVVGGGIWMNTQRPEWNDANNAIVGIGLSMVTVYQLYRHLKLCGELLDAGDDVTVSSELKEWLRRLAAIYGKYSGQLAGSGGKLKRAILDETELAFEAYRKTIYRDGIGGKEKLSRAEISDFLKTALVYLEYTIDQNEEGGLYHAYNLLKLKSGGLDIVPLFPMLEGQTAILGSGRLSPQSALTLLENMEKSGLYSKDFETFYLYPIKKVKGFMEKNIIPDEEAAHSELICKLLADGGLGIVIRDAEGHVRFHYGICQAKDLSFALDALASDSRWDGLIRKERDAMLEIFDKVFRHSEFSGRSGVMYKYEGIGSIYWHQNSKFLLSLQESYAAALRESGEASASRPVLLPALRAALRAAYYRVRKGLGFNKEPGLWGALPLEPYSHTPYKMPAQQPGMTGQVKEEIITRRLELGLFVENGAIRIEPGLLRRAEFLLEPQVFRYVGFNGSVSEIDLEKGMLGYTICQTPVLYRLAGENRIDAYLSDGSVNSIEGLSLGLALSRSIFGREGKVLRLEVSIEGNLIED